MGRRHKDLYLIIVSLSWRCVTTFPVVVLFYIWGGGGELIGKPLCCYIPCHKACITGWGSVTRLDWWKAAASLFSLVHSEQSPSSTQHSGPSSVVSIIFRIWNTKLLGNIRPTVPARGHSTRHKYLNFLILKFIPFVNKGGYSAWVRCINFFPSKVARC